MRSVSRLCLVLLATLTLPLAGQKNCKKGIPCGNSCIAANKVCRLATPPAAQATAPAPSSNAAKAAQAAPLATLANPGLPWVASPQGRTYYVNGSGCAGGRKLKSRIYFKSEADAVAKGYGRSSQKGC